MNMQRMAKKPSKPGHTLDVLLVELERECEAVLKLLHQLDVVGLPDDQREEILGELSAAERRKLLKIRTVTVAFITRPYSQLITQ